MPNFAWPGQETENQGLTSIWVCSWGLNLAIDLIVLVIATSAGVIHDFVITAYQCVQCLKHV